MFAVADRSIDRVAPVWLRSGEPQLRAGAVLEELDRNPGAAVFFHDYHLYLAGIRAGRAPDAVLAHFVHVPWPQSDYWHVPRTTSGRRDTKVAW